MFYYLPVWNFYFPENDFPQESNQTQQILLQNQSQIKEMANNQQNKCQFYAKYFKIFQEELQILAQKKHKKIWSLQQDQKLIKIRKYIQDWEQISKLFEGTNPEMCRRSLKWTKELNEEIRTLYRQNGTSWTYIANQINKKFGGEFIYTSKLVKQHYEFYLKEGICNREWSIQQDLKLLKEVREKGKKWKSMLGKFEGRTELQLKNRYNGTLKLVQKRVLKKIRKLGIEC